MTSRELRFLERFGIEYRTTPRKTIFPVLATPNWAINPQLSRESKVYFAVFEDNRFRMTLYDFTGWIKLKSSRITLKFDKDSNKLYAYDGENIVEIPRLPIPVVLRRFLEKHAKSFIYKQIPYNASVMCDIDSKVKAKWFVAGNEVKDLQAFRRMRVHIPDHVWLVVVFPNGFAKVLYMQKEGEGK
jgi:hypothetical protein